MFADKVEIEIRAGKGGDGKLSFLHEKYRAYGGADGGDGGRGGDIVFIVDHNLNTLSTYRTNREIKAKGGNPGGGNRRAGRQGEDVYVKVPVGTQVYEVYEDDAPRLLADLTEPGQEAILARGGKGGFGNAHFKSSTRQTPKVAELGEPGEYRRVVLELKLVADVGLVGLPNAGKSTLLSVITNARPEIADYPFTTLIPNLGVVDIDNYTFLAADIPGLIEGASEGKGLGDEFLRHIERTAVLFHLIDAGGEDVVADWKTIENELGSYTVDLREKAQLIVLSKSETVDEKELAKKKKALEKATKSTVYVISAQEHKGLTELLRGSLPLIEAARAQVEQERADAEVPVIDISTLPDAWQIEELPEGGYRINGDRIEAFARRTNFDQIAALDRLRDIMRKMGIAKALEKLGVEPGDIIKIGQGELPWR